MDQEPDFEMVREDPPRALPDSYREIKNNIERVRMSASGEWFRIARFTRMSEPANKRLTLSKRPEYQLFEFRAGKLDPAEPPYVSGLWCKWIGVKKPKKREAPSETTPPARLRAVRDHR